MILGRLTDYFAIFGVSAASFLLLKCMCSLWSGLKAYVVGKAIGLTANLKNMGQWAVVTGATDGIGKAYAQELAKLGMDIVLISRSPEKLEDVAGEIESKSKVKTKCIAVDFTTGPEIYTNIKFQLTGMDIGVLVNNVGLSYEYPEYYAEIQDDQRIRNMLKLNVNSVTEMTRIVLPSMAEKRKGAIINVSSASGLKPSPLLSLYSATKAFVDVFSRALNAEYKSKGIIVQCVVPFFVATKLSKIRRPTLFVPGPSQYVRSALATVGIEDLTFGWIPHALQGYAVLRMPQCVYNWFTMKTLLPLRTKAKKRAQEKKE